jgi:hypothetical protein
VSILPKLPPHRPSAAVKAARLDFAVGSRGWAYVLEGDRFINKGEIDDAQDLINACRKSGDLPLDICSEDDKRAAENLERIDPKPREEARDILAYVQSAEKSYTPFSFWDDLDVFVQTGTEKSNLKNLFAKPCAEFHVPIANIGGWGDLNVRAGFMQRFKEKEAEGKQCVLLYFGDFDPGGLHISDFLRSNLADMSRAVGWWPDNLIIDRFGLDIGFIRKQRLTWINNLATSNGKYPLDDERHPDHNKPYVQTYLKAYGPRKVESDALLKVPEIGRELCRQAILKYVPASAPRRYHAQLRPMREELRRELDRLLIRGVGK